MIESGFYCKADEVRKKTAQEIIDFLETLKVKDDGFGIWKARKNYYIEDCQKAIKIKYGVEVKYD